MRLIELLFLRLTLWVGLPILLVVLAVGPARSWRLVRQAWSWIWQKRLRPEEILSKVVEQHEQHVALLKQMIAQADDGEATIRANLRTSEENSARLEEEAKTLVSRGDELGAKGALYKLNLEQLALGAFRQHLEKQRTLIVDARRRLYQTELQLRQYEVGRTILLSQLADAKSVEHQYEIAEQFDPYNAVANWQQAEGMVLDRALNAKALQRVHEDISKFTSPDAAAHVDPQMLDAQLAALLAGSQASQAAQPAPREQASEGSDEGSVQETSPSDERRRVRKKQ